MGGLLGSALIKDQQSQWYLTLELVVNPENRAFCYIRMVGNHLFHLPGRQTVAGYVYDIVGSTHNMHIVLPVDKAGIAGAVILGELGEILFDKTFIIVPKGR